MNSSIQAPKHRVVIGMGSSLLLLLIMVSFIGQTLAASRMAANLDSSYKAVDLDEAEAGQSLQYTILISNTGDMSATNVLLNDTLPTELIYQTDSLSVTAGSNYVTAAYGEDNGVITWTGTISGPGYVALAFEAMLLATLSPGDVVTNTAVLTGTGSLLTRTATTTVISPSLSVPNLYLPAIFNPVPVPDLQISSPVNNQWTVSWSNLGASISYELEEANTLDFANATTYALSTTSQNISHSQPNVYFYRVRAVIAGQAGGWSEVKAVFVGQLTLTATQPNQFNAWSVGWTDGGSGVTTYELQESHSELFASPQSYIVQSQGRTFLHAPSPDNYYCYRVRSVAADQAGPWSNVVCLAGGYRDDFSDDSTNWAIRRQDTDDVDNKFYYQEKDGEKFFVLEIDGRWDYGLASPLRPAPEPPYAIEARVRLNKPDNLNVYGFVFGGDWDGASACPNGDYDSCFNHYYRLTFLWFGAQSTLKMQLTRIDSHDPDDNGGQGPNLIGYGDVAVSTPSESFQILRIEVGADGLIEVFVNGKKEGGVIDTTYINDPYFGVFAATDEYLGAEPWYDWYEVMPLPEE